jgi:hypothetical protein
MRGPGRPEKSPAPSIARGRPFARGNPGRKHGSRNRTTVVAAALLDGEAGALVRRGVELALAGNVALLTFFLGRIRPRERLVKLELPAMQYADDGVEALGRIMRAVSEGVISPSEGAALANLVNAYTTAIDKADLVKRLDALEAQIRGDVQRGSG